MIDLVDQAFRLKFKLRSILESGGYITSVRRERLNHAYVKAESRINRRLDKKVYPKFLVDGGRA